MKCYTRLCSNTSVPLHQSSPLLSVWLSVEARSAAAFWLCACLAFRLFGAENERRGWKKGRGLDWAFQWERSWIVVLTLNSSKFPQCKNTVKVCGRSFSGISFFLFESTTHTVCAKVAQSVYPLLLTWITALASHVSQDRFKNPITKWFKCISDLLVHHKALPQVIWDRFTQCCQDEN